MSRKKELLFYLVMLVLLGIPLWLTVRFYDRQHDLWVHSLIGYREAHQPGYADPEFPKLTDQQVVQLGWAHTPDDHPRVSYIHRPEKKRPGVTRIGVFGCSAARGSESGYGYDFPSLMQKRFDELGLRNVEVVNFGVGSYGLHQSYYLWEELGRKYELDTILINAYDWHATRDGSFVFSNMYFVHGRYLLDEGDTLRWLPVQGKSRLEAAENYHALFQKGQYLVYDIRQPNFLKPLMAEPKRYACNPLYHADSCAPQSEMLDTYAAIFKNMKAVTPQVIVLTYDSVIGSLHERLEPEGVHFADLAEAGIQRSVSLFTAPGLHRSPSGNQYIADQIVRMLTKSTQPIKITTVADFVPAPAAPPRVGPIFEYDSVALEIDGVRFETLRTPENGNPQRLTVPVRFQEDRIASLLVLSTELTNIQLSPLDFPLSADQTVAFHAVVDGQTYNVPVGRVRPWADTIGRLELDDGFNASIVQIAAGDGWALTWNTTESLLGGVYLTGSNADRLESIEIAIGEHRGILPGSAQEVAVPEEMRFLLGDGSMQKIRFQANRHIYLRSHEDEYIDPARGKTEGVVTLNLARQDRVEKIPVFVWRKITEARGLPNLPDSIPALGR